MYLEPSVEEWSKAARETFSMDEVKDLLGLDDSVNQFSNDSMIRNYFEYEQGKSLPILKNRLESAVDYWENVLKAPHSVLNVIKNGFPIDFLVEPPQYDFKNNKSALNEQNFVNEAIDELVKFGLIEEWVEKPHVVSPLSVAKNSEGKMRLILDLSIVNEYVRYEKIKLEDARDWFEMSKLCNYVVSFDIKECILL